jgi:hypothetical protein
MSTSKTMKKMLPAFLCAVLSISCSLGQFLPVMDDSPASAPPPTDTFTPVPTRTPIPPTFTFTPTPTLIDLRAEATATLMPLETATPLAQIIGSTLTPAIQMKGFLSVNVTPREFYKGRNCEPFSVKFIAQVVDPVASAHVLLFVRFRSVQSGNASRWTSIPMGTIGAGTFIHDLTSDQMIGEELYRNSWVEYQIVITNTSGREIGRTDIFRENLLVMDCVTATPAP